MLKSIQKKGPPRLKYSEEMRKGHQFPLPNEVQTELGKRGGGGTRQCNVMQDQSAKIIYIAADRS